ncbi:MAG: peptidoglycan DD-metalloendopeptidase family protein [Gammaproteobacteria bacterium]|nr:peptidoglycan DD-metalloendopeptidase family protein [Gammaproteobacteria bacterium]
MKRVPELNQTNDTAHSPKSRVKPGHAFAAVIVTVSALAFFGLSATTESAVSPSLSGDDRYQVSLSLPHDLDQANSQLPAADQEHQWQTFVVKNGDTLASIFDRAGVSATQLSAMLSQDKKIKSSLTRLNPGQELKLRTNENGDLQELVFKQNETDSIIAKREGEMFLFDHDQRQYQRRATYARGVINSSLFEAGRESGLSDSLTMDLAHIFGWDIDFALDIRSGDRFVVVFEELFLDGKRVGDGNILAAEFVNQGQTYQAVRYVDPEGNANYYTPDGKSMRKAFLRTPLDIGRVSSRFGMRHHPILNTVRAHKGVDYAAPVGTPVKSSGDGKVVFRGIKGGYGKVIVIDHGNGYTTLYGHLNSYSRKLRDGYRVKQGETIGFVGSTGRATGPHLHYEFRVGGVHRNPLTVSLPQAKPVAQKYRIDFELATRSWIAQLALANNINLAQLSSD